MSVLKRRVRLNGLSGCVVCVCTCVCMCVHVEAEVNFGYLSKLLFTLFFSWISLLQPIWGASEPQDGSVLASQLWACNCASFCLSFVFVLSLF